MRKKNCYKPYGGRRRKGWLIALCALLLAGVLAFTALEVVIYSGGRTRIAEGEGAPEIMVLFGCQVKPWGPSTLLRDRLDAALDYLADHPDMRVVVTGGKGDDEHISEAQCMYDYLTEHGVPGENILMEDQSRNTWQNISNTRALLGELFDSGAVEPTGNYLLVSSDFHLVRIRLLWGRLWDGTHTLSTLAAPCTHVPSRVKMFFREPLALVKSYLFDR